MPEVVDWSAFDDLDNCRPGLVAAVVREDRVEGWRSVGTEWPDGPPLQTSSLLYVSSIAKQFTAACVGLLVLEGAVGLDNDVRRWIPELPPYPSTVRIGHLLAHTSGLPDANAVDNRAGFSIERPFTTAQRVALIATLELEDEPGSRHRYCNHGYVLLAQLVGRASGACLGAFAGARIFGPLAMSSTAFLDSPSPVAVPGWDNGRRRVEIGTTCTGDGGLAGWLAMALWEGRSCDVAPSKTTAYLAAGG